MKQITKNHRTGNEQLIGCAHLMKWSAVNYWLWYIFTTKKSTLLVKLIKHTKTLNWKFLVKNPKKIQLLKKESFLSELLMQENVTLFLCHLWWDFRNPTCYMRKILYLGKHCTWLLTESCFRIMCNPSLHFHTVHFMTYWLTCFAQRATENTLM